MLYEDNDTEVLTCLQQTLGEDNSTSEFQSSTLATVDASLRSIVQIVLLPFTLVLNLLVIIVVVKTKKLQAPPFYAALQLVCCNIIVSLLSTSSTASSAIGGGWIFGPVPCILSGVMFSMLNTAKTLMLLIIAIDRALYVFAPIAYSKIHKKVFILLCVIVWLVLAVFSILSLPGIMDCYGYLSTHLVCLFVDFCHSHCKAYIAVRYIIHLPAYTVPILLYSCMYCKAKKLKRNSSSASAEKPKPDYKVTITFFLLFLSTVLMLIPAGVVTLLTAITNPSEIVKIITAILITIILRASSITEPIFILRNETAKMALYQMIKVTTKKWKLSRGSYDISKLTE